MHTSDSASQTKAASAEHHGLFCITYSQEEKLLLLVADSPINYPRLVQIRELHHPELLMQMRGLHTS